MTIICGFILAGVRKKVNVYDAFIEGAKDGFTTAVRIIPYLVAILVGIGVFRASGAMDMLIGGMRWCVELTGVNAQWVDAMPTALMKPLSGSGARGMMVDAMTTYGADSFVGRLSCVLSAFAIPATQYPAAFWQTWLESSRPLLSVIYSLASRLVELEKPEINDLWEN